MAKKFFSKALSVGLSLALCAGMVAPAFAASFAELQDAVNSDGGTKFTYTAEDGTTSTRYGYGDSLNDEKTKYELEAWTGDDGTRNIQLNADVKYDKAGEDAERVGGIFVWKDPVSIDLNGYDIDMNPDAVLNAEDGNFYVAEKDENGNKVATETVATNLNSGTVITVVNNTSVTITDSSAETCVGKDGETHYVAGTGTGTITGGNAQGGNDNLRKPGVGAVYVESNSSFTMNGGSISGNRSDQSALCAENTAKGAFGAKTEVTLDGVTVENNRTEHAGTTYFVAKSGEVDVTIKGCEIAGNVAEGDAIDFGLHNNGQSLTAEIKDTTITGNRLDKDDQRGDDHGAVALWQDNGKVLDITFEGCTIQNNGGGCTGIYYHNEDGDGLKIVGLNNTICGNGTLGEKGVSVKDKDGKTLGAMHTDAYWETLDDKDVTDATCVAEGSISYTCPFCKDVHTVGTDINPDNHDMGKWEVTIPATCEEDGVKTRTCQREGCSHEETESIDALGHDMGEWYVSKKAGPGVAGEERCDCRREGCDYAETRPIDPLPVPTPVPDSTVEIDDEEIPLSGLFTRADAIGYLWEQSGSPEWELSDFPDVPEDHEWAVAIGWAQDMGIAVADEDGNFRPDDLVLRSTEDAEGELQEFLNRYAVYGGIELDEDELFIELFGAADDIIMGEEAQAIFDDFFVKLEAALAQAA